MAVEIGADEDAPWLFDLLGEVFLKAEQSRSALGDRLTEVPSPHAHHPPDNRHRACPRPAPKWPTSSP
jgi:hypothetical protein